MFFTTSFVIKYVKIFVLFTNSLVVGYNSDMIFVIQHGSIKSYSCVLYSFKILRNILQT